LREFFVPQLLPGNAAFTVGEPPPDLFGKLRRFKNQSLVLGLFFEQPGDEIEALVLRQFLDR